MKFSKVKKVTMTLHKIVKRLRFANGKILDIFKNPKIVILSEKSKCFAITKKFISLRI